MNAFDNVIKRIDEINIDKELVPIFIEAMNLMSDYFNNLDGLQTNYDEFFEKNLYNNLNIVVVDELDANAAGAYSQKQNSIKFLSNQINSKFSVHILIHEFIHFIIHKQFPRLPSWADEMMTEYLTTQIHKTEFRVYASLMNIFKFVDANIENIKVEDFLNGNFMKFIEKYNLFEVEYNFKNCSLFSFNKIDDQQTIICHFIKYKLQELLKENITYKEFYDKYVELVVKQKFFNKNLAVLDFCYFTKLFLDKKSLNIDFIEYADQIRDEIKPLFIKSYLEYKTSLTFDFMQKICVKDVENYIAYSKDKICVLFNANRDVDIVCVLDKNCDYHFYSFENKIKYEVVKNSKGNLFLNDAMLEFNDKTKKYECKTIKFEKEYDCSKYVLFNKLVRTINQVVAKSTKNTYVKNIKCFKSDESSIDERLNQLNNFVNYLNCEIYCGSASNFVVEYKQKKEPCLFPVYSLDEKTISNAKLIENLNKNEIDKIVKDMKNGAQVNIFTKDKNNEIYPLVNVIKNTKDDDYVINFNYEKFMRIFSNQERNEIINNILPKQDYEKTIIR